MLTVTKLLLDRGETSAAQKASGGGSAPKHRRTCSEMLRILQLTFLVGPLYCSRHWKIQARSQALFPVLLELFTSSQAGSILWKFPKDLKA